MPVIAAGLPKMLAVSGIAATALAVSGCEKPDPTVTIFTGDTSVREQADCWAPGNETLATEECATDILDGSRPFSDRIIFANAGDTVGISVDPDVSEAGWIVRLAGQSWVTQPITESYFRFPMPFGTPEEGLPLQVVAGGDAEIKGVWLFRLVPNLP